MENPEVAQVVDDVAEPLAIQGANPFRVPAYRNAAHTIRYLSAPLAEMDAEKREGLAGIGKDLAGKIRALASRARLVCLLQ